MTDKFTIDFFEFCFLVEVCIPPRPIARAMFFDNVSSVYYHQMNKNQRANLFEWVQKNPNFDLANKDCLHFYDRFNPDNQYVVTTEWEGEEVGWETYKHNGQYHEDGSSSILEKHIKKIEKI